MELRDLYHAALEACAPERLVRDALPADAPRDVVAIGKCAAAMLRGVPDVHDAFLAIPAGYPVPSGGAAASAAHRRRGGGGSTGIAIGGHPHMTRASFEAGRKLLDFVDTHHDLLFLISGGGSACVEVPLIREDEVIAQNARLIASGMTIAEINARRKAMSAIKGGKLRERVKGRCVTLVLSDVSTGRLTDVASGPTITRNEEAILIADNRTLVLHAARIAREAVAGGRWRMADDGNALPPHVRTLDEQLECDVEEAARMLDVQPGELLIAGGEPTVKVRGDGKGGRCSELALRYARIAPPGVEALFASSDGVDGNSGAAGVLIRTPVDTTEIEAVLARSDSFSLASRLGEPIMISPTGNNLRDLYLLARR